MNNNLVILTISIILTFSNSANSLANDEISLFNQSGEATAYIAITDEMTIYMWSGKPVAYLENDDAGGFHVYGFNGKHLGWFINGIVRDHRGDASCATKDAIQSHQYEPYKSYKQYKPYKSYQEYAPYKPYFSNSFGETVCEILLGAGQ